MIKRDSDAFTLDGSTAMAAKIKSLWHSKGFFDVHTWVEPFHIRLGGREGVDALYQVRSNLVNALPPRKVAVAA